ncbi:hypothetical protein [Streptomyces sp. NPDC057413]|uniref:hypothetical protein n=1 Tax=Streptomyces sp. NPDC057413 TaxID=3346124 RepID=UPI003681D30B
MERTDQPAQPPSPAQPSGRIVLNYDNHGTFWGAATVTDTEQDIATARAAGLHVDEWETSDRDGHPLRVVRIPNPGFLDDICVFTTTTNLAVKL